MSKMNELMQTLDALTACGETLIRSASAIREMFKSDAVLTPAHVHDQPWPEKGEPAQQEPPMKGPEAKTYAKEDVRAMLAELSQTGHRAEAKALVSKYSGGGTFADVPAAKYNELVKEIKSYA